MVALHVARACRLEADFRTSDCAAIVHVARKRERLMPALQGRGWLRVLLDYTRLYSRRGARARVTQQLPWGDVDSWSARRNRAWSQLRAHALRLVRGEVADPCQRAMHWRGPRVDVLPANMRPVRCSERTANQMLALRRN